MSFKIVGTCSHCSGPVTVPTIWMGIYPPIPECKHCQVRAKRPHGPIVEMEDKEPVPSNAYDWIDDLQVVS